MNENGCKLIRCDQCFMKVPQKIIFQSICRCRFGRSVSGQSWINVESMIFWRKRKGRMRCVWRYVEVNSDRYEGQGQCCRRVELFICSKRSVSLSVSHHCIRHPCSLHRSQLSHPISPYTLNLDGRMYFSPKLLCKTLLVGLVRIISPASQTCVPSWTFTIFENVIVIVFVLSVVDSYGATLCSPGRGSILRGGLGNDGGEQGVSISSKAGSIA